MNGCLHPAKPVPVLIAAFVGLPGGHRGEALTPGDQHTRRPLFPLVLHPLRRRHARPPRPISPRGFRDGAFFRAVPSANRDTGWGHRESTRNPRGVMRRMTASTREHSGHHRFRNDFPRLLAPRDPVARRGDRETHLAAQPELRAFGTQPRMKRRPHSPKKPAPSAGSLGDNSECCRISDTYRGKEPTCLQRPSPTRRPPPLS